MKLTKVDVAEALGLELWDEGSYNGEFLTTTFIFHGKYIYVEHGFSETLGEAWEEAAEKLLEPLVDYLLGNLDD